MNLRVLKLYPSIWVLSHRSSQLLNPIIQSKRNAATLPALRFQASNEFPYLYERNELIEKTTYSPDQLCINNSKSFLNLGTIKSIDDIHFFVHNVIKSAKFGQNVPKMICYGASANSFESFLNYLGSHTYEDMSADDVVSTLIALNLLEVPLYHPVNQKLSIRIAHLLKGKLKRLKFSICKAYQFK